MIEKRSSLGKENSKAEESPSKTEEEIRIERHDRYLRWERVILEYNDSEEALLIRKALNQRSLDITDVASMIRKKMKHIHEREKEETFNCPDKTNAFYRNRYLEYYLMSVESEYYISNTSLAKDEISIEDKHKRIRNYYLAVNNATKHRWYYEDLHLSFEDKKRQQRLTKYDLFEWAPNSSVLYKHDRGLPANILLYFKPHWRPAYDNILVFVFDYCFPDNGDKVGDRNSVLEALLKEFAKFPRPSLI